MVMCARCHKRIAVVFITKMENGQRTSEGLCMRCAKEVGLPVNNMLDGIAGQMGITPEQISSMEDSMNEMMAAPSESDGVEDGGAPAIDMPSLFGEDGSEGVGNLGKSLSALFGELKKNGENHPAPQNPDGNRQKRGNQSGQTKGKSGKELKYLTTYCRNLTEAARRGKLDSIVGRERELSRVTQILCRRQKNNPCLIGEPGVGKTAIAEALAIRVAKGDVPYKLKNKEIYLVDLTALVAGTQFRGQFESRILGLLGEVQSEGNVILVIDEVHNIVGTGEAEGSVNAANILKPALSRGEVQIIGATTLTEYRKYIEKDTALERRFQPVTVEEPSVAESVEMLKGIKHYYEEYHNITIPEGVLVKAVTMSERYITDRYLPDKAIDLLDEAAAHLSLSSGELNETYEIRDRLLEIKTRREALEAQETPDGDEKAMQRRYEELASIKAEELKLSARLSELEPGCSAITLTAHELASVIEVWTGIPATTVTENEYEQVDKLEARLKEHIVGQDKAVSAVARAVKRNRAGVSAKRKPVSFIFAGPTGVGKTELVKTLANDLFHSPETLIRLDMSEFMEKESVSRIIGSPPGYVGYDDAGQLTEKIRRKPYSVVLFDEIEKAHPDVLNILLQILDDGRLTDAHGKTVNFENTVIVMTTNAGSDRQTASIGFGTTEDQAEDATMKALSAFLRPEFINRVDEVVTFRALSKEDFTRIVRIMLGELTDALAEKSLTLKYTDAAAALIAEKSFSAKFGARNMRRYIQRNVEDPIAEAVIADYAHTLSHIMVHVKDGELKVSCI
ncbi:MAG: ATP-dependent Clp protease ATP-binding subunit [Clostridia bacterium]|nr:ATP-dependent Clp protease ATP-binding subunit [Clostridia bacterium]